MEKRNLTELIEFDDLKILQKVLADRPGYRMVLLNLRSGQNIPEHSTRERISVYAISGHITFYEDQTAVDLRTGEVLWIGGNVPHRLEAHEDSSLLVFRAGEVPTVEAELDLRSVPRAERHPLVFTSFDKLSVGDSMILVNDHDPVPLHLQMANLRSGQLAWEYLIRGPRIFRIRIRRVAPFTGSEVSPSAPSTTVSEIRPA